MTVVQQMLKEGRPDALIAESDDWDNLISPALVELATRGFLPIDIDKAKVLRVIFECVYYRGYLRGLAAKEIKLVVPDFSEPIDSHPADEADPPQCSLYRRDWTENRYGDTDPPGQCPLCQRDWSECHCDE